MRTVRTIYWLGALALLGLPACTRDSVKTGAEKNPDSTSNTNKGTVELSQNQLAAIKIETIGTYMFPKEEEAVGSIACVDDRNVQVFPTVQGKLLKTFADLGDEVKKGQVLYTIDSPDLVGAESTLIAAAATYDLTTRELARAKELAAGGGGGVSQRELEQAATDQQTAEGALKAARDAVRVFGKTDAQIAQIISSRKIDSALAVSSPLDGQVTAYNAPPGLLVQPGNQPAPFTISDESVKWMLADVPETDAPLYRVGQVVQATVLAYPGRIFEGKIAKVYANVDPATHRMTVRCEIPDATDELRPGMLADFNIRVQEPVQATAIPVNGVVRNGDGTYSAWVTIDRQHFSQRIVRTGLEKDGRYQVLDGLHPGELAVTDGAIFLNNILEAPPSD